METKVSSDYLEEVQTIISFQRFFQDTRGELEEIGQFFQVAIYFHPGHLQPGATINASCGKLDHQF